MLKVTDCNSHRGELVMNLIKLCATYRSLYWVIDADCHYIKCMNILFKKKQLKKPRWCFFFLSCVFLEHRRDENIWILKHLQLSLNNNVEIEHFCCWNPLPVLTCMWSFKVSRSFIFCIFRDLFCFTKM